MRKLNTAYQFIVDNWASMTIPQICVALDKERGYVTAIAAKLRGRGFDLPLKSRSPVSADCSIQRNSAILKQLQTAHKAGTLYGTNAYYALVNDILGNGPYDLARMKSSFNHYIRKYHAGNMEEIVTKTGQPMDKTRPGKLLCMTSWVDAGRVGDCFV
jgi:hypothetical protein